MTLFWFSHFYLQQFSWSWFCNTYCPEIKNLRCGALLEMGTRKHSALHQTNIVRNSQILRTRMNIESVKVWAGANKLSWTWAAEWAWRFWQTKHMKRLLPFLVGHTQGGVFPVWMSGTPSQCWLSKQNPFSLHRPLLWGIPRFDSGCLSLCSAFQFVCCWAASTIDHGGSFARLSGLPLVLCEANVVPAKFNSCGSSQWESCHTFPKMQVTPKRNSSTSVVLNL